MINVIDQWMAEDITNFNTFVGLTMIVYIGSLLVLFIVGKKFGRPDERTNAIYLRLTSTMFLTQMILMGIFISLVDRDIEHFRQFFIFSQGLVFLVGAMNAIGLYRKEFR